MLGKKLEKFFFDVFGRIEDTKIFFWNFMAFHWKYYITQWPQIDMKSAKNNYLLLLKKHASHNPFKVGIFPNWGISWNWKVKYVSVPR